MRFLRRAVAIAATIAVTMPVLAVPVAAFPAVAGKDACGSDQTGAAVAQVARGAYGVKGKQFAEPDLGQVATDLPANAKGRARSNFSVTVDVYFHVISNGSVGNLTTQQINDQIRVLNKTYAGQEGGAYTGFSFRLAEVTRTDNANWYAARPGAEYQFKKALKRGDDTDLNIYTTSGYLYLGWAYYPQITDSNQSYLDGVVLDWRTVPGASDAYAGAYDQGETLTHELGHWFNLAHTFNNGCAEPGDFVDDTPAQATPTNGCPVGQDSCPTLPGLDPIHNYMDYSFDSCYTGFTQGQTQRMRDAWLLYRAP